MVSTSYIRLKATELYKGGPLQLRETMQFDGDSRFQAVVSLEIIVTLLWWTGPNAATGQIVHMSSAQLRETTACA